MAFLDFLPAIGSVLDYFNQDRTTDQNLANTQEALSAAQNEINQGADIAYDLIASGQAEAAAAIIEGSEEAASYILEWYGVAEGVQREFFNIASQKLQPFVDLGLSAFNEMASMLGIAGSDGKVVPFDLRKLEETPGYQFQQQEGQKAVERSQVGRNLSGRAAKEIMRYGQDLAQNYFHARLGQLSQLGQFGAQAAGNQAQIAAQTGSNLGQTAMTAGTNLARIAQGEGEAMANLATGTANNLASIELDRSDDLQNVQLSGAIAQNNANTQQADNFTNLLETTIPILSSSGPIAKRQPTSQNLLKRKPGDVYAPGSPIDPYGRITY